MTKSYQKIGAPVLMFLAAISLSLIVSCGGGSESDPMTKGDKILAAVEGTWSFPTTGIPTDAANSITSPQITISKSANGATFTSDANSGLANFISGGSFSVGDDGTISSPVVNAAANSNLTISGASVTATETQVVVSFTAAASARQDGTGGWTITVPIN